MTARAVGRETIEQYLVNGEFKGDNAAAGKSPADATARTPNKLREMTLQNLRKALQYRSAEDKERFQAKAAAWAASEIFRLSD